MLEIRLIVRAAHTIAAAVWVGGNIFYLLVALPALRSGGAAPGVARAGTGAERGCQDAATDQHAAVNAERDEQLRGPASGVLHQHDAGHAEFFDGPAINGADLFAAKKAHGN